jgi:hypothetical protein
VFRIVSLLPAENGSAVERRGGRALGGDKGLERRTFGGGLKLAGLAVEALQGLHFLFTSELCLEHGRFHDPDGLVVDLEGNWVGMAVFSAVGQREAGRIPKAVGCPVNDLRDHGERPHRARSDARRQQ